MTCPKCNCILNYLNIDSDGVEFVCFNRSCPDHYEPFQDSDKHNFSFVDINGNEHKFQ